jgi:APA family basic amino acid/polyamine antiporter
VTEVVTFYIRLPEFYNLIANSNKSILKKLPVSFGLPVAISVVAGSIIGSGIFMKPATMAGKLGSPELLIAVWIGAGLITLFGALSIAEVAAMIPETGGLYVYFRRMYGDFFAYLYGWSAFAVFNTEGIASIAYVFGTYLEYFITLPRFPVAMEHSIDLYIPFVGHIFPLENIGVKTVTILVLLVLTFLNYRSSVFGGKVLAWFTGLKIIAIVMVILTVFFKGHGNPLHFIQDAPAIQLQGWALIGGIVAALSGAFWAYDGWTNITAIGGEIRDPQRNIPKALWMGLSICILLYVLLTLSFMYVMPIGDMAASGMIASDVSKIVLGSIGGGLIALLVLLSTFGAVQGNVLSVTRVTFAMARENHFFKTAGSIHPRFETQGHALWIHGVWSSLLVLSGTFDTLTDMVIFSSWFFYGMTALGVFVLRLKMKDVPRPYRVWGYPVIPGIYVIFTFFFLIITLVNDISNYISGKTVIIQSVFALLMMAAGIPLYFYFKRKIQPHAK